MGPKAVWILWDIQRLLLDCPARAGHRGTILRCSSPQAIPCTNVVTDGQVIRMEVAVSSALILSYLGRNFGTETPTVLGEIQTCEGFIISEPIFYFQYGLSYELLVLTYSRQTRAFTWTGRGLRPFKTPILGTVFTSTVSSDIHQSNRHTLHFTYELYLIIRSEMHTTS